MTPGAFHYEHRVTYGDCTVGNHVYYGRYLDILEAARGALFRSVGLPFLQLQEQDAIFPVIECQLRYSAPAKYDDVLAIQTWLSKVDRVRMQFEYSVTRPPEQKILRASTVHACTSIDGRPRRIPEALQSALQQFLQS